MKAIKNRFSPYQNGEILLWGKVKVEIIGSNERGDKLRIYKVQGVDKMISETGFKYVFHKDLQPIN